MNQSNLEILQQRRLEEIGRYLYQIREERSVSLDLIVNQTKIQRHQLRNIELGNMDHLPPAIYVQGFIKLYANALGFNGREIASTFPIDLDYDG